MLEYTDYTSYAKRLGSGIAGKLKGGNFLKNREDIKTAGLEVAETLTKPWPKKDYDDDPVENDKANIAQHKNILNIWLGDGTNNNENFKFSRGLINDLANIVAVNEIYPCPEDLAEIRNQLAKRLNDMIFDTGISEQSTDSLIKSMKEVAKDLFRNQKQATNER